MLYFLFLARAVVSVGGNGCYRIENIEAVSHFAESGILPVEMRRILVHDEKL